MTLFDAPDAPPRTITLVRLAGLLAKSFAELGVFVVEGEVHQPKLHGSGRWFFTLRDRNAQISVTCSPKAAAKARIVAGERIAVTGRLEFVPHFGKVQLLALEVAPRGEGAIAAAIERARQRLAAEGVLTRARRPMPRLPRRIGVVCGAEAAVRKDIESVVAARFPGYPVDFLEVNVSGLGAAESVAEAVRVLDLRHDVDVVILARGGGDAAQLLPFSDEDLCRAIAASSTPVVSAIGHDGDRPLCDEVADLRCGTPSLAAAAVVPDLAALQRELAVHLERAQAAVDRGTSSATQRLARIDRSRALSTGIALAASRVERAGARLPLVHPQVRLDAARRGLAHLVPTPLVRRRFDTAVAQLGARRDRMEALSPARVLDRGYAVVRRADGAVVRDPAEAPVPTALRIQVAGGTLAAVTTEEAGDGASQ